MRCTADACVTCNVNVVSRGLRARFGGVGLGVTLGKVINFPSKLEEFSMGVSDLTANLE